MRIFSFDIAGFRTAQQSVGMWNRRDRVLTATALVAAIAAAQPITPQIAFAGPGASEIQVYKSPVEAYRAGVKAFRRGDIAGSIKALEYASDKGLVAAKLNLARIHLKGVAGPKEPAVAFRLFRQITEDYVGISPRHPYAGYVSAAFVELGKCYQRGVEEMGLEPNDSKAADYFVHAASLFGNPEAQYLLARLYIQGNGIPKNVRLARHWLVSASKKGYAPAQAYLGQLLWQGRILKRRPVKALALISLAQANARREDAGWIAVIYRSILEQAQPAEQSRARAVVAKWRRVYGVRDQRRIDNAGFRKPDDKDKAKGIGVRPYTPGEGTEGDSGHIMASPSSMSGNGEGANSLAQRVRKHSPGEGSSGTALGIMHGGLGNTGGYREVGSEYPKR